MHTKLKWYSFRWQTGIAALIPAFLVWYALAGRYQHPVGSGPAGPSVNRQAFSHTWSTQKHVLIGIGDSITEGYGATGDHGYFDLLVKNDDTAYPEMKGCDLSTVLPNLEHSNYSVSYTTSQEHLADQVPAIPKYPKIVKGIVVITSGGNDLIHDYGRSPARDGAMYGCTTEQAMQWTPSYHKRLKRIIESVNSRFPGGCEIFLANVYDPTDGVGDIHHANVVLPKWPSGMQALSLFNRTIAEVCEEYPNVHLVDIHEQFLGHGIHCSDRRNAHYRTDDPHYWYFANLEDPNDRGYDAIRRTFLIEMAVVLRKG